MAECSNSDFRAQRQGRCDTFATEFDLEAEEYVPLPKGDVHKKKEIVQDVTLHDLDVANARPQVWKLCALCTLQTNTTELREPLPPNRFSMVVRHLISGRPRHSVHDGTADEAQEDRNHR